MFLETINKENDIKKIRKEDYDKLAEEIREFLIEKISMCGGHLASNLGVVELTMALHLSLDLPNDKIVWDVGHQSYTHKILTGRKDEFNKLRAYGGVSGFPKRRESECDAFDTGHSSTSVSAALGIVTGYGLSGNDGTVVAVIGDGALTGGMAFEALNNASNINRNFIIVLNDNHMSISENVGGLSSYLTGIRTDEKYNDIKAGVVKSLNSIPVVGEKLVSNIRKTKDSIKQLVVPGMLFENMGIVYLGPVDGHNITQMVKVFREAKSLDKAVLIHVITKKGKGYKPAEKHPSRFHGTGPFDKETGRSIVPKTKESYTDVFSNAIVEAAGKHDNIVAVSAAMPDGTGLTSFSKEFPERFFDVGIAEQHAVTFAAGLAVSGYRPFVAIYSSFLQRAYDQILHDVCIQDLPIVFAIDRAGLVGGDGETHQGIFDISYLRTIPNMSICAPKNKWELEDMISYASYSSGPIAIRYPRDVAWTGLEEYREPIKYGKAEVIYDEKDILLFAEGNMVKSACKVRDVLKERGYFVSLVNARFIKPFDEELICEMSRRHSLIVTLEDNVLNGGFGEGVTRFVENNCKESDVLNIGVPNIYVEHGSLKDIRKESHLDTETIVERIVDKMERRANV
ncbi:MAG: 1-deoxy-D-xylulose-5-phosphate synthase [Lachnospiraceae bacterium]|nr:1-deoxy-D-xylulose-5-phosphate synthase [Lachnospiraceae bacterium]